MANNQLSWGCRINTHGLGVCLFCFESHEIRNTECGGKEGGVLWFRYFLMDNGMKVTCHSPFNVSEHIRSHVFISLVRINITVPYIRLWNTAQNRLNKLIKMVQLITNHMPPCICESLYLLVGNSYVLYFCFSQQCQSQVWSPVLISSSVAIPLNLVLANFFSKRLGFLGQLQLFSSAIVAQKQP